MIKGIPVTLYQRTVTGHDPLGAPIATEVPVVVENVLVSPAAAEAVVQGLQLYGKRAVYELSIPKGDTHDWTDCRVDFFGSSFRAFGPQREWIEAMVPLQWNKKVQVERYE